MFSKWQLEDTLPWIFFSLSTLILMMAPFLSQLASKFEKQSKVIKILVHVTLVVFVIFHIGNEAMKSSGVHSLLFALSGFLVAIGLSSMAQLMQVRSLPVIPFSIAAIMSLHGIFDGYAFRIASSVSTWYSANSLQETTQSLLFFSSTNWNISAYTLAIACVIHRIPESLFLWRLISTRISRRFAILSLTTLAISTFIGLILSDELLSSGRMIYLNISYLQVFIGGFILHAAMEAYLPFLCGCDKIDISTKKTKTVC